MTSEANTIHPDHLDKMHAEEDTNATKAHEENAQVFRNDLSTTDVANYYSSWAPGYEKGFHIEGFYLGPGYVVETLEQIYKKKRESIRVLDVAAGTGIVGEKLYKAGFRNIDGIDPSAGMLDICRSKSIYTNLICAFITEDPTNIATDAYDCIGCSGGFGPGHIPKEALRELIRIVKPGGHICFIVREEYIEMSENYNNNKLYDTMFNLEKSGLWKKVDRRVVPGYVYNKPGVLCLYRVL